MLPWIHMPLLKALWMQRVVDTALQSLDCRDAAEQLLNCVCAALECDCGSLLMLNAASDPELHVRAVVGGHPVPATVSATSPLMERLAAAPRAVILRHDARACLALGLPPAGAVMVVRLQDGPCWFGLLCIAASGRRQFDADHACLLEALAARVLLALRHRQRLESLEAALAQRDNLLANVSHDLRTPLNAIALNTDILLRQAPGHERRRTGHKQVMRIGHAVQRMERQLQDLLDGASIRAGGLRIHTVPCSLSALLDEVEDLVQPLAIKKALRLSIEAPMTDLHVQCDASRTVQVLCNLLDNAIKFSREGAAIEVRAIKSGRREVRFSIADAGPGIPAHQLGCVFERFWTGRQAGRRGTGLGLSIARGIIEAHAGRLWVESQEGRGSTFFFTLPEAFAKPS